MKYLSLLFLATAQTHAVGTQFLCFYSDKSVSDCVSDNWVASAEFSPAKDHPSNFGELIVTTSNEYTDSSQMFAAGYLEGAITAELIYQHYNNMLCQVDCSGYVAPEIQAFFTAQDIWARKQVQAHKNSSYWQFVGDVLSQMDGLVAGYRASTFAQEADHALPLWAFTMINSIGDLFDIIPAVSPSRRPNFNKMSYRQSVDYFRKNGHCSAFIKLADDMSDMYMGHSSWFTYSAMLRIYKTYAFSLGNSDSKTSRMSFSSYPGMLSSLDDFYLMDDSKLVMIQTTNSIYNATLWDLVAPESLLAWQRVRAANQLSSTGSDWFEIIALHNSGTYNNQYMIVDGKKFKPGNALQPGSLFVVEQIPGHVAGSDLTDILEKGYWSSYNVPYHQDIYVESGYGSVDEKNGQALYTEYQMAPRAQIFRREEGGVVDLSSMQYLMRFNEFQSDPLAAGSPWNAICARGDLESTSPYAGGGYDTKVTTWSRVMSTGDCPMEALVLNGPTAQDQPPFQWSTSGLGDTNSHLGMPDVFDFEFESVNSKSTAGC